MAVREWRREKKIDGAQNLLVRPLVHFGMAAQYLCSQTGLNYCGNFIFM